ncbi:MAG: septum formation initiator family protein [Candidatus Omnitrophica bacterium]|nr:septum formation initiator family protein [Candidatus Omnitrophota bacterium]
MLSLLKRVFCVFGALLFLLIVFLPGYTKLQELRDKNRDLRSQIKRLHQENALLEEKLKRLENDPVYQEEVVRERLGVVRKGEIPVKIIAEE